MRTVTRRIYAMALCLLFLAGCGQKTGEYAGGLGREDNDKADQAKKIPVYERSTSRYSLPEDAIPYKMAFTEQGFFYYVMEMQGSEDADEEGAGPVYRFYYQPYEEKTAKPFGVVTGGYIRDFRGVLRNGNMYLDVLIGGDGASILEFDEAGREWGATTLEESFNTVDRMQKLLVQPGKGFVIGMGEEVFLLDPEGTVRESRKLDGTVRELCQTKEGELLALVDQNLDRRSMVRLIRLDRGEPLELSGDLMELFPFEDGLLAVYGDRLDFFLMGEEGETLMDLNRQGLFASQIQYAFGERGELRLVSMDVSDISQGVFLYVFREKEESWEGGYAGREGDPGREGRDFAWGNGAEAKGQEEYAPDGRRIMRVAVPENCYYQMDFHAKKYNQVSDDSYVQIDWFEGSLEDYLGKGNRPDVIMFQDQIEAQEYVEKGVLADLLPLFEESETYSLDQLIPEAEGLLSLAGEEGIYVIPWIVRLLLRASDGSERDEDGKWDDIRFLTWYDDYMTAQEIPGVGELENLLFAALPDYYDEAAATADFTSGDFQELMRTFKEVAERHVGKLDGNEIALGKGVDVLEMAAFSKWYAGYRIRALRVPEIRMTGLPGRWGESIVTLRMVFPMGILNTTGQRQEAFDFILYFASLQEPLMKGWPESDYGKNGGIAPAYFNLFEKNLRESVYETDLPFDIYVEFDEKGRPIPGTGYDFFYTEEHKEQLRHLLAQAKAETRAQRVIFGMLQEEMEPYVRGQKDLESACEVLQNRAQLYLKEQVR